MSSHEERIYEIYTKYFKELNFFFYSLPCKKAGGKSICRDSQT